VLKNSNKVAFLVVLNFENNQNLIKINQKTIKINQNILKKGGIMANGQGGYRIGSGRKKSAENIGENALKNKFKELKGEDIPKPDSYLSMQTKGASENCAGKIYEKIWIWLQERGCDVLITPNQVEQYAMSVARWIQAEDAIHTFGFLAKHPTTGAPISSPYVKIAQDFMKQSTNLWLQIYGVVKENCIEYANNNNVNANDDMMEMILSTQPMRGLNAKDN